MRGAVLLLVCACDGPTSESAWTEVEVPEAAGVSFRDVSATGDRAVAVGSRDGGERGAALVIEGDSWTAIDAPDLPPFEDVFAAAADDVWAAAPGNDEPAPLWRWDGTSWSMVELPDGVLGVSEVWGTGPDDVWIAATFDAAAPERARAYHWDGGALTEHRDFFALLEVPDDGLTRLYLTAGCSRSPGDVWLAGDVAKETADVGEGFHFDGEQWESHRMGQPREIVCLETDTWYLGAEELGTFVGRWQEGRWVSSTWFESGARVASLDAAAGSLWVVGDESDDSDAAVAQIWRLTDGALVRTLLESAPRTTRAEPQLRALYQTPAGTIRALGTDGLVLEHAGDP